MNPIPLVARVAVLVAAVTPLLSLRGYGQSSDAASILERVRRHEFHPVDGGFTKDARLDHHGIADLDDTDWRVRTLGVRDLTRIGAPAVGALLEGLGSDDLHVRHVSALALGIFPTAETFAGTVPARREALRRRLEGDSSPIVRSEAAIALGRVGGSDAVPVLRTARDHDASRDVRHQCELALDRLDKKTDDREVFDAYRSMEESRFGRVAVGKPAMDFMLRDTDGRPWKLADHLGKRPVVLIWIFADWCPVCHGEFRDLIGMKDEFLESDVEIVTIECHDRYRARVMAGQELDPSYGFSKKSPQETYRKGRDWPHLSDPAGAVGAVYGVQPLAFAVHSEYINRPSTIIIDEDGVVRFAYYGTYWGDRPSIEQTLEMVREGKYEFEHPRRLASGGAN